MNGINAEEIRKEDKVDYKKTGIKMAKEVVQTLSKSIKTLKIYPDSSPLRQKFVTELRDKFTMFLDEYGDLTLNVRQTELLYNGEVVYTSPSKEENMALKFYGDGIRELIFSVDLDENEILDFMSIVSGDYDGEADDDIVTILWERDYKNIQYTIVDVGESGGEGGEPEKGNKPSSAAHGSTGGSAPSGDALKKAFTNEAGKSENQGGMSLKPSGVELEIEHIYGKPFSEIFTLTPEEIEKVQQEMEREEGIDLISELLDILFHIIQIERDLDSYSETIGNIERALKTMILSGDYQRIIPIVTTLKSLSLHENNFSPDHAEEARKAVDALGEKEFLEQLALSINVNKVADTDSLISFLTMLNMNAIGPIASLLGSLDQMKTRRLFCDALALLARDNIEPLMESLEDDNWYIVRNVVYTLGKIGDPRAVSYINKIKDHEEPRIRKEIVHTLTEIKSDEAKELLRYFLNDSNNSIRVAALKNLATLGYQKAVSNILNIISSDSFDAKEVFEKKELFDTLGKLGSEEILPFLRETLMRYTRFFGRARVEENRVYAALALQRMATPRAIKILKEGKASSDKGIQKVCEEALKQLEKEMN